MTALSLLVEPLKRELAVPGVFEDTFPDTDDAALADTLADSFGEAQLMGFFSTIDLGAAPEYETSLDISRAGGYLVVLFAGQRILRAWLRSLSTTERYKAGSVEFETTRGINLLRDELALIKSRLDLLIADSRRRARMVPAVVIDSYWARTAGELVGSGVNSPYGPMGVGAFIEYELGGFTPYELGD